jgi:hypothetical protein
MKVQANAAPGKRAKAIPGYDACEFKPLIRRLIRRIVIWLSNIVASPNDEGPNELPSPSLTVSWSLSIIS